MSDAARTSAFSDSGATVVEYAIMLAAIAGVVIAVAFSLGLQLPPTFQDILNGFG